jgi:hypothetical protein
MVAPFGTYVEVPLLPPDHDVFLAIRPSLGLNHAESLALLEEGLTWAPHGFVACHFTTLHSVTTVTGGGRGSKHAYAHHTPDKEGVSTLIMLEPVWLVMVSSGGMHAMESLRIDGQGTLFIGTTLLLCFLPSRWLTDKIEVSTL